MKVLIAIIAMLVIVLPAPSFALDTKPASKPQVTLAKSNTCSRQDARQDIKNWANEARAKGFKGVQIGNYVAERFREERGSCRTYT